MLGKAGVFLRGDEDYVAGIVTGVFPVQKYDENTGQWQDAGKERYSVALFDGGSVRFVDDVDPDDFGDNIDGFSGRSESTADAYDPGSGTVAADLSRPQAESQPSSPVLASGVQPSDVPTPAVIPGHSDAPEIPAEHPTTGTEEATTVTPPAEATEPQPQQ